MLKNIDKGWLDYNHPSLSIESWGLSGKVSIKATYNKQTNQFLILGNNDIDTINGLCLVGEFELELKNRSTPGYSNLPALTIKGIKNYPNRHINPDGTACLCSPLEEGRYLSGTFEDFFDKLVIPFLYGQLYFSEYNRWPWREFSHGIAGILESYYIANDPMKAQDCIDKLRISEYWQRLEVVLNKKGKIKGHTACFCPKGGKLKCCHYKAWLGVRKLKRDIKKNKE